MEGNTFTCFSIDVNGKPSQERETWKLKKQLTDGTTQTVYVTGYFTVGGNGYREFGSGTRLYVTAEPVVKPKVSVYPASRADLKGKSSLLCLATSMFPPLVRFSWRRGGEPVDLGETVELGEPGRPASIMLIDREKAAADRYVCSVEHQGGAVEARIPAQTDFSFQSQCRVKLLSLVYTVMIVKSMVYCCGLSLLMIHTNKGGSTNTHAD
ncbi:immunoglobulin lambda-1 light chain-like [Centroberyx affinis]|uniref:immunoglobulin lambda-1 light chain-like n=1 Tax=Centroberyx affinis TaxID=166261 RepID=UPI003A5B9FF9